MSTDGPEALATAADLSMDPWARIEAGVIVTDYDKRREALTSAITAHEVDTEPSKIISTATAFLAFLSGGGAVPSETSA